MRTVLSILLAAALLGGCGSAGSSTDTRGAEGVELTYHRSGGIGGIEETLRIHRSGSATLAEGRPPTKAGMIRFELSAAAGGRHSGG